MKCVLKAVNLSNQKRQLTTLANKIGMYAML